MKEFIIEYKYNGNTDILSLLASNQEEATKRILSISKKLKLTGFREAQIGGFINRLDHPSIR